jgi:orotate phosphoribosyltransferase
MQYVRKKPKGFGRNAQIEGDIREGARTLLVEDLTTDGGSKINFVRALRDAGAIVVVVTHDLEAIAGRADHVAILRRGQLVFEQRGSYTYAALKDLYHHHAN